MDKDKTHIVGSKHASSFRYSLLVGAKVKIDEPYHHNQYVVHEVEEPYRGLDIASKEGPRWIVHQEDLLPLEMDNQSALILLKQI